jgi:hypothetical protein
MASRTECIRKWRVTRVNRIDGAWLHLFRDYNDIDGPGPDRATPLVWFSGAWMLVGGIVIAASAAFSRNRSIAAAG